MRKLRVTDGKVYLDDLELTDVKKIKIKSSAKSLTELTVTMLVELTGNESVAFEKEKPADYLKSLQDSAKKYHEKTGKSTFTI